MTVIQELVKDYDTAVKVTSTAKLKQQEATEKLLQEILQQRIFWAIELRRSVLYRLRRE